jgi:general secretion pathway protein M
MKRINIKLARREKIIVSAGACLVGLFVLLRFFVFPFFSGRTKVRRGIEVDKQRLQEVMNLSVEYEGLQSKPGGVQEALAGREKGFTLFAFLEGVAGQAGLKDRIKYIKPSTSQDKGQYKVSSVEMQFEGITMRQLFDYLYRIEDPKNVVKIKRISIKKHKEKSGYLDATMQALTVQSA